MSMRVARDAAGDVRAHDARRGAAMRARIARDARGRCWRGGAAEPRRRIGAPPRRSLAIVTDSDQPKRPSRNSTYTTEASITSELQTIACGPSTQR